MKKSIVKKSTKVKNVTLDDLARMMAGGFTEVGQRFDEVYDRFDELDGRLTGKIDELDERLSGQMRVLDQKIDIVNTNVLSLQYDYRKVISRIEKIELKMFGSLQE